MCFPASSMKQCLTTGSLVCHRDRNQQQRTASYSTSSGRKPDQDWSSLLTRLAGLGVSLTAFLVSVSQTRIKQLLQTNLSSFSFVYISVCLTLSVQPEKCRQIDLVVFFSLQEKELASAILCHKIFSVIFYSNSFQK